MNYRRMGRSGLKVSEICLGTMTSAIVGARTVEQARDNFLAGSFQLPTDALERLNKISQLSPRYPRSMEDPMAERRNSAMK